MSEKQPEQKQNGPIPYFSTTERDGVSVPLKQTLIIAGSWGLAAIVATLLIAWAWNLFSPSLFGVDKPASLEVVAFFACLAGAATFFPIAIIEWPKNRDHWEYIVEIGMGADLNQDGYIGAPPVEPKRQVEVTLKDAKGEGWSRFNLPYEDRLRVLALPVLNGVENLSGRTWSGKRGLKLFDPDEWEEVAAELRNRGLAKYKNPAFPNLGMELTAAGRAVFRSLVREGEGTLHPAIPPAPEQIPMQSNNLDVSPLPQARKRV